MPKPVLTDNEIEARILEIIAMHPSGRHSLHQIMSAIERSDFDVTVQRVATVTNDMIKKGVLNQVCIGAKTLYRQFGVALAPEIVQKRSPEDMVE